MKTNTENKNIKCCFMTTSMNRETQQSNISGSYGKMKDEIPINWGQVRKIKEKFVHIIIVLVEYSCHHHHHLNNVFKEYGKLYCVIGTSAIWARQSPMVVWQNDHLMTDHIWVALNSECRILKPNTLAALPLIHQTICVMSHRTA